MHLYPQQENKAWLSYYVYLNHTTRHTTETRDTLWQATRNWDDDINDVSVVT